MVIQNMDAERCRKMLARIGYGRLACTKDKQPYIVPMYFASEGNNVYGFSVEGQKIDWMRANPLVCLEVDEVTSQFDWKTVIATGRYEELTDAPEFRTERTLAEKLLQQRYMSWQTPYEILYHQRARESSSPVFYAVRITHISGLAAKPEPFEGPAL